MLTWKKIIKQKLEKFPEIKFEEEAKVLKVLPKDANGFYVKIDQTIEDDEYNITVFYGEAWHNHYADEQEAIRWFFFGLSNKCRLKVCYFDEVLYKGIVESHFGNDWCGENISGSIFYPFWKKRRIEYLSNDLIPFEGKLRV